MQYFFHLAIVFAVLANTIGLYATSPCTNTAFSQETQCRAQNSHPMVAISAFYSESRLQYLSQVLASLSTFPRATIILYTNSISDMQLSSLEDICKKELGYRGQAISWEIRKCAVEPHNYNLTWEHKPAIKDEFLHSNEYTHFIYLEDDEELTFDNFQYFLEYREKLRNRGLLPALVRVEYHKGLNDFTVTDQPGPVTVANCPHFTLDGFMLINLNHPYMGCFILDQELAAEYVDSLSFGVETSLKRTGWHIRERSAAGVCFENIPTGFTSRYVIPVDQNAHTIPKCVWIRHLPNNYADWEGMGYGKTPVNNLFIW